MAGLLKPLQRLSAGLTKASDALMPRAPTFGLLTPQQQQEADQQARLQFLGSILQQAGPSLQPNSGFQAIGSAIQQSQEAANKAAQSQLQGQMFNRQMEMDQQRLGLQQRQFGLDQAKLAASLQGDAAEIDDKMIDRLFKLSGEIQDESKGFITQRDAMARVAAAAADPSPAGDLALIFSYMKVLDPGSTVREGEFANAQNAGSVPDRFRALYNSVIEGTRLSTEQRADFLSRSQKLFGAARSDQERRNERFRLRAKDANVSRGIDNILVPLDPASGMGPQTQVPNIPQPVPPPPPGATPELTIDLGQL